LHELLIYVTKVRFQLDRYACLTVPVRDPQSVNICQVNARYSRAASTRRVRLSFYTTPTSRSSRRRLYQTLSSMNFSVTFNRRTSFPYVLSLSLTPPCPNTAQQSPRNADTTRHRHRVRHRVTSPTSRLTRRRSRDTATTVDHGDAASYQRRRLVASRRDAASHQRRSLASP